MAGPLPRGSNRFRAKRCSSSKVPCTRHCTVSSNRAGSRPSGGKPIRAVWPSSIRSRAQDAGSSKRSSKTGQGCRLRSTSWYRRPDVRVIDKLTLRLRSLFRRKKVEAELEDELRFHLDQLVNE